MTERNEAVALNLHRTRKAVEVILAKEMLVRDMAACDEDRLPAEGGCRALVEVLHYLNDQIAAIEEHLTAYCENKAA